MGHTEEVARYECVYHRNSKDFKDKNKKLTAGKKIREKFNLSAVEAEVKFRTIRTACGRYLKRLKTLPSGAGRDAVPREFRNLEWVNPHIAHRPSSTNLRSKSTSAMLFAAIFPLAQRACNFDIFADRNVWQQSAPRSFAIVCDYLETNLFAIVCDWRSAIVCDYMETSLLEADKNAACVENSCNSVYNTRSKIKRVLERRKHMETLTTPDTTRFGTKQSLLIVILIGTPAGSKRRFT